MNFLRAAVVFPLVLSLAACSAEMAPEEETSEVEDAVTSGKITDRRPEIGLVHVEGVRGPMGDMGWATGTVVLGRNTVLTSAKATGERSLRTGASAYGTFTVTSSSGKTTHRIVETRTIDGSALALLRIEPPVDASITPATIADPETVRRVRRTHSQSTTFFGYGYRNLVCMPMTGSDGYKSHVTRRYAAFGGLFTGPLGVGYTCEADIGGPIVLGGVNDRGAVLSINTSTVLDAFAEPGLVRPALESVASSWR